MKKRIFSTLAITALFAGTALAQDPVKVSGNYYKTLFENDAVRVLKMRLPAGAEDVMHEHPDESVYFVKGGTLSITLPDGNRVKKTLKDGEVMAHEAWIHQVKNAGKTEVVAIITERKPDVFSKERHLTKEDTLAEVKKDFGFVPNLMKEMAESPAAPLVYTKSDLLMHHAKLSQKEQQAVQLIVSLYNGCDYCSSMHSKFSELNGVSHEDVLAIRRGEFPEDKHIGNLMWVTRTILDKRGHLSEKDREIIADMGIDRGKLYEIIVHIGRKIIANYSVHIIHPELDEEFVFEE